MFTDPAVRGQRIGVSLLDAIETRAKRSASNGWCLKPALARGLLPPSGFTRTMASPNVASCLIIPNPAIPGSLKRSCPHE
jgi:GNAT superfamily N-acetyltransferase